MRYILGVLFATSAFAQTAVFPGAVAGDAQMAVAVNQVQTILRTSIGSSDTSATVVSSTGFVVNSIASISGPGNSGSSEEVWVCSVVGNVLSFGRASCPSIDGRGIDSTTVVAHNAGAQVSAYVDAWHHNSEKVEITAIERHSPQFINISDYGAVADWNGTTGTDNLAAFNSAITAAQTAGKPLVMPCGSYYVSASITLSVQSLLDWGGCMTTSPIEGVTARGTWLVFGAGGIALTGYSDILTLHDFGVRALASAGPNLSIGGNSGFDEFRYLALVSQNPAQPLIDANPGATGDLDQLNFEAVEVVPAAGHSVPAIYFHTLGGVITPVRFSGRYARQWTGSATASAPFFKADNGGLAEFQLFAFEDILSEVTPAGLFDFNGVDNVQMSNIAESDSTMTAPVVKITSRASWKIGQYSFLNCFFADGSANTTSPSLLVAIGSSAGQGRISAQGGYIGYTRITGNTSGTAAYYANVRTLDLYDYIPASGVTAFGASASNFPPGAGFGLNTSSSIGRSALMSAPNSHVNLANCAYATDLAVDATDTHKVTSGTVTFVADDEGAYVYVYTGSTSGFNIGQPIRIVKVSGGAAFLQSEAGTAGLTGGKFSVGRTAMGAEWVVNVPANHSDYFPTCSANAAASVTTKRFLETGGPSIFSAIPAVDQPMYWIVTDSTTNAWGANVAGTGANRVLAWWNGSNWTVVGK